jgi:energy-coupling factor transport system substrate-specific component
MVLAVVLAELAEGGLDAKAVAMLGVLTAVGAALRPLGTGIAGFEPVFFLLVLAGRVHGPGFGFVLGSTTLFASALVTGGVGPWLPFQMLGRSVGRCGRGAPPPGERPSRARAPRGVRGGGRPALRRAAQPVVLALHAREGTAISFVAGDPVLDNLRRFLTFTAASPRSGSTSPGRS